MLSQGCQGKNRARSSSTHSPGRATAVPATDASSEQPSQTPAAASESRGSSGSCNAAASSSAAEGFRAPPLTRRSVMSEGRTLGSSFAAQLSVKASTVCSKSTSFTEANRAPGTSKRFTQALTDAANVLSAPQRQAFFKAWNEHGPGRDHGPRKG